MRTDLNAIHTATNCLHELLGVLYEVSTELDFTDHNPVAERLSSLLILARDEMERIDGAIGDAITSAGMAARTEVDVIRTLGEEYEEALAAWNIAGAAADIEGAPETLKRAEEAAGQHHDNYRDALFAFKPVSPGAFAEKATILLRVWDSAEGMNDRRIVQLLQSMGGRS